MTRNLQEVQQKAACREVSSLGTATGRGPPPDEDDGQDKPLKKYFAARPTIDFFDQLQLQDRRRSSRLPSTDVCLGVGAGGTVKNWGATNGGRGGGAGEIWSV